MKTDEFVITLLSIVALTKDKVHASLLHLVLDAVNAIFEGSTSTALLRAELYAHVGDYARAIDFLRKLLQKYPNSLAIKNSLGIKLIEMDMVGGRELLREVALAEARDGDLYEIDIATIKLAKEILSNILGETEKITIFTTNAAQMMRA